MIDSAKYPHSVLLTFPVNGNPGSAEADADHRVREHFRWIEANCVGDLKWQSKVEITAVIHFANERDARIFALKFGGSLLPTVQP